jgi:tetratricopeptide (TPR) repeat protein
MALAVLIQAAVALAVTPTAPAAGDRAANAAIQRARAAFNGLRYDEAEAGYREALATGGQQPDGLTEIYLQLGIIAAYSNRTEEAVDLFTRMLLIDPRASVPAEASPKVQRPFTDAQAALSKLKPCSLEHVPVQRWPDAGDLELRLSWDTDSLGMAQGVWLLQRNAGDPTYRVAEQRERGTVIFTVDRQQVPTAAVVEYYIELRDANGNALRSIGTAAKPVSVAAQVPTAVGSGEDGSPWPWIVAGSATITLIGAGAIAVAIAYYLIPPAPPDFGKIEHHIGQSW